MSSEDMLTVFNGVFAEYDERHRRRLKPIELRNVNMVRDQSHKARAKPTSIQEIKPLETKEFADIPNNEMSAIDLTTEKGQQQPLGEYEVKEHLEFWKVFESIKEIKGTQENLVTWLSPNDKNDKTSVLTLSLPVIIKVNAKEQTAKVEVDKDTFDLRALGKDKEFISPKKKFST
jgi:hypothetical protein